MERRYFEHDCTKCQGLCCIATVRTGKGFASQDQIGQPCKHLTGDFRCRIHHQLEKKGFAECVPYRCKSVGNRLTRILRIGDIPDITKPKNPRQKDLARVISEIFKDIEWIMSFLEGFQKKGLTEKFELFQKEAETLFQEMEAIVRTEGNVYVIIPKTVELNAKIRAVKKEITAREGLPLILGKHPAGSEERRALNHLMNFGPAQLPQMLFDRMLASEVGPDVPNPEKLKKYVFAICQFGLSFYGKPAIWEGVTEEEAIKLSAEAAMIYAEYEDSQDDYNLAELAKAIFLKCQTVQFQEETIIQVQ